MNLTPCGNYYSTPDGRLPRVSRVLDCLGKPWIEKWEARLEREMVTAAAMSLYADLPDYGHKMSNLTYSMALGQRIGKEKAADKVIQKAQDVGTAVHKLIQWELHKELGLKVGKAPTVDGEGLNAFTQYQAWRDSVHLAPVAVEQMVWNAVDGYAGQLDLLSRVNGKMAIVDFKTSKAIYPEYELQSAAYARAVNAVVGQPVERAFVVRLPKRAGDGFEAYEVPSLSDAYEAFCHVLGTWKWLEARKDLTVTLPRGSTNGVAGWN